MHKINAFISNIDIFNPDDQTTSYWPSELTTPTSGSALCVVTLNENEVEPFSFFHSRANVRYREPTGLISDTELMYKNSIVDRKFVQINSLFKAQFDKLSKYLDGVDFNEAKAKLNISLSEILAVNPDVISMELTSDKSIFYTLKKQNFVFFISHFLEILDIEDDEVAMTVFKNKIKQSSQAGTLEEVIAELKDVLKITYPISKASPLYAIPN